ncbi:MAG: ABC transporter permease subunit [Acidobacteriia bacterium]|nr:ABC transporter permease subunit [Terriglobia bacterium]
MSTRPLSRPLVPHRAGSIATDVLILGLGLAVFWGILSAGRAWLGPFTPAPPLSTSPRALPLYTAYSLLRIGAAYALSLVFAVGYGYVAAYHRGAERILIPLLDVLQSIPVLSFLPGVMLAMVALSPHRQLGVELGAILLIFTGQVWNMAFSFYASIKGMPEDLREVASACRFGAWQRFVRLEMPCSARGLVWNSMMSVAGGWFFLMACEMFVLGHRDFRLPGLGSYLETAAGAGDLRGILWGLAAMVGAIVLLDQLAWRPVLAWAEKFKLEQVEAAEVKHSAVLDLLRRSRLVPLLSRTFLAPLRGRLSLRLARRAARPERPAPPGPLRIWTVRVLAAVLLAIVAWAAVRAVATLLTLKGPDALTILRGAGATFLRVNAALLLGALWTVPVGVAVGSSPRLARVAQPLAQIAASVPATALFPVLLLALVRAGGGLGIGSILLMLLGTQWYVLFNVIAGASAIPTDLEEAALTFRFGRIQRWRLLVLPGIFPHLITGLVTASGGAWNASIVAEYFHFRGKILSTTGLGATISQATDAGNYAMLLGSTVVMAAIVITVNRVVWRPLYALAGTRFTMDA